MKTIQKLEICTGVATPIATLLYIYIGVFQPTILSINFKGEISSETIVFGSMFALVLLSSFLVAVGAYFDAKGSDIGVDALYVGGAFLIVILGLWGFLILAYEGILNGLLVYSPVILSALTIIFALSSRKKVSLKTF